MTTRHATDTRRSPQRRHVGPLPPVVPGGTKTVQQLVAETLRTLPPTPAQVPSWSHRLLPATARRLMADLGLWRNPQPQKPSAHLEQTLAVLERYGWAQTQNTTITGRVCVNGAQHVLEKTGHVTAETRQRAVAYMQAALAQAGIHMSFFTWNDLPDQQFSAVRTLLTTAARLAKENGE